MAYLIVKAIHVMAVVAWFAGLFYIFRLYVYHTENRHNQEVTALFIVMERRLYYAIMWPAMVVATAMGVALIVMLPEWLKAGWLHVKLAALVLLYGYHFYSGYIRKKLSQGIYLLSSKQCRMINEVPTFILIIVVVMVIIRPF
jgi:putative membrane protein